MFSTVYFLYFLPIMVPFASVTENFNSNLGAALSYPDRILDNPEKFTAKKKK